jgi:formate dehydrogenase iron-sulfur subunit
VSAVMQPTGVPAGHEAWGDEAKTRVGFFTDTSVCIGCKACEVACKECNLIPQDGQEWLGRSYDHTGELNANTWRHVAFIEQEKPLRRLLEAPAAEPPAPGDEGRPPSAGLNGDGTTGLRWLMESDVCKHCSHAACLDVCPTGSLFRTEFGTVVVQEDICNGCGYCVPACPFGVLDKREIPSDKNVGFKPDLPSILGKKKDGRVWKCTLCYDRLKGGHEPACAKACPTKSIQFGPLEELREQADARLEKLQEEGWNGAQLYLRDPDDGVGGAGAFFLLLDDPEVYGLPPDPVVTTKYLGEMWVNMATAAAVLAVGVVGAFLGGRK